MTSTFEHTHIIEPGSTIALTGATGFVGGHILRALLDAGYSVRALARDPQRAKEAQRSPDIEWIKGDALAPETLSDLVQGCRAVVHLVGIIEERPGKGITFQRLHVDATRNIIEATRKAGIARYLHMSALGTRANAVSAYHRSKYEAETIVRQSDLAWTIFQPSMILGPGGEFTTMMRAWARGKAPPFLFLPYFGTGVLGFGRKSRIQPIAVEDVAASFTAALTHPKSIEKTYELGGPETMTWPEMLVRARDLTPGAGRRRKPVPIPAWLALLMARAAEAVRLSALLPFNSAQVLMSREDSVCDAAQATAELGLDLTPIDRALAAEPAPT